MLCMTFYSGVNLRGVFTKAEVCIFVILLLGTPVQHSIH